jgi:serine/threonine protein kinase/tetratricopeptide (TPR) repeat protein
MSVDLNKARDLFLHAVGKLPPEEWDRYVVEACGGDADLAAQVIHMLLVHREAGSFLDRPAVEGAVDDGDAGAGGTARQVLERSSAGGTMDEPADGAGTIIAGRYKLLQQIGEGGMGTVWMGEQTEPVKRRVAVKLIRVERGQSKTILSRFEAERQAIAVMDHPHIARLLDAGEAPPAHPGGAPRPFFVMELVKGLPLTEFCDAQKLSMPERLRLFVQVCAAVQHAHQKGIIHRDLKPSNILVESHDGKPVPKIIDFGLAKATTGLQLSEHTLFTAFGTVMGTPLYMAPEQAGASALDVDSRADIYALGIILYELLTGSTPITRDTLKKAALDEMLKLIREQEVPTPSSRLSSVESAPSVAANRQTEPAKLGRFVRGDLDWIVLKALAKERDRRYETANGLAKDIERFLNHEPVTAGPPEVVYRLRKFVRRNRGPVAAAGLVFFTLIGGIAGTTLALLQAERNAKQARDERDAKDAALKAEQQARADETKARQQAFAALRSMSSDVIERKFAQGTVLTEDDRAFLRGVIAQYDAFAAIKGDDADSRAVRAEGRWKIADIRATLGELKEAEQGYDQAVSLYSQLASNYPGRPEFRESLSHCQDSRGILRNETGRPKQAEQDFSEVLGILKQLATDFPSRTDFQRDLAAFHLNRGIALCAMGRLTEAEKEFDEALKLMELLAADLSTDPKFRKTRAEIHLNRGVMLHETGRPEASEQDYDKAVSMQKQLAADFPTNLEYRKLLALSHSNRANLMRKTRRPEEAEQDYNQALGLYRQLAADFPTVPDFRHQLARSLNIRSILLQDLGRSAEAEKDYDQSLSILNQLAADFPNRPEFRHEQAASHNNRGNLLRANGRLKEAADEYHQALRIERQLVLENPNRATAQHDVAMYSFNLAAITRLQGNWADAKRFLLEGRPHSLSALKISPNNSQYRDVYRSQLRLLIEAHARLLEPQESVRTAEAYRDLGWDGPMDAYRAACYLSRCISVVAKHDKLDDRQRREAAQAYGDVATKLLRDAVNKGYKDVTELKKSTDLDPLRQREDFRKLVAELEVKEG